MQRPLHSAFHSLRVTSMQGETKFPWTDWLYKKSRKLNLLFQANESLSLPALFRVHTNTFLAKYLFSFEKPSKKFEQSWNLFPTGGDKYSRKTSRNTFLHLPLVTVHICRQAKTRTDGGAVVHTPHSSWCAFGLYFNLNFLSRIFICMWSHAIPEGSFRNNGFMVSSDCLRTTYAARCSCLGDNSAKFAHRDKFHKYKEYRVVKA